MKNMYVIIGIVAVLVVGGVGFIVLSGGEEVTDQQQNNVSQASSAEPVEPATTEQSAEDAELMRFVEKDSIEYKTHYRLQEKSMINISLRI